MSVLTIELPDELARELERGNVAREQLDDFVVKAVEAWVARLRGAEGSRGSWDETFETSAVAFVDGLIAENRELFDELARR